MNRVIPAIALNTFRETVRDRIMYAFVIFAFVITLLGLLLGSLSIGQDIRILQDLGLFIIAIIGGIIAIFVGTTLVYKEIDRKTIYLIITKPISRWQFVVGKYLGLSLSIFVVTALMGLFLMAAVALFTYDFHFALWMCGSLALIYLELLLVIAMATFFSTFATPLMSFIFTAGLWIISHLSQSLVALGNVSTSALVKNMSQAIYYLLPDLSQLNQIRAGLMYFRPANLETLLFLSAYILSYIVILLTVSTIITERREFQ